MKNKRREFLKNVCPTVALAFFGVTMLEACSSGGEDEMIGGNGVILVLDRETMETLIMVTL